MRVREIAIECLNTLRSYPAVLMLIVLGMLPLEVSAWFARGMWFWFRWLLSMTIHEVAFAALVCAVGTSATGERPSVFRSYAVVLGHLPWVMAYVIVYFGAIVLLTATVIGIPVALILLVRWAFGIHGIILRDLEFKQALRFSAAIVRGLWWQTLGILLLVAALWSVPSWIPVLLAGNVTPLSFSASVLVGLFAMPAAASLSTHLFLQLVERMRVYEGTSGEFGRVAGLMVG